MSMKTLKTLLWSLLCLTFVVSCEKAPVDDSKEPGDGPVVDWVSVIKPKKSSISVGIAGGDYTLEYELQNPYPGTKLSASTSVDWVESVDCSTPNVIKIKVAPNNGSETRQCILTIEYRFADPVAVTIKQGARIDKGFSLENITPTYFDYTVDVIPEDKETPYIVMSAHPEYIVASGFKTGQDFYEDDVLYFDWLGQFYGLDAVGIMQARAKTGDEREIVVSNGAAGVPYTFYCYYFDWESGALLSDVQMFTIWTSAPEQANIEFDMQYEIIDGVMVSADVIAKNYDGHYYFDVLPKVLVDSYLYDLVTLEGEQIFTTNEEVLSYWWSDAIADMMQDMSADDIIANYTSVGLNGDGTPRSHYDFELLSNVDYYLFAFAMEENGLCSSVPQIVPFRTGNVSMSDNVITPSYEKLTARTAKFHFDAANDDYYVAGWEKLSDWKTYGNTDAEIQQHLLMNTEFALLKGDVSTSVRDLEPATDYVLYAFGSRGGVATTTEIFKLEFRTKDGGAGSVSMSFKDLGYYDCSDFANIDGYEYLSGENYAGMVVFPYEVEFSSEDHGDYFFEIYDWTGRHESEYYTEKQYMDGLLYMIETFGSLTATHTYTFLEIGGIYELVGVVLDMDGMFSSLYRQWVKPTYDGCRNADEFVAWWDAYQESQKDDELEDGGNTGLQSLVVDYTGTELFSKKGNVAKAAKFSTTTIESKEVVPTLGDVAIRK